MISCQIFGNPIETGAVVDEEHLVSYEKVSEESLPETRLFSYELDQKDIVYGLGETMGGINKRGKSYVSYNTDDPHHRQSMPSMYGAHNFFIIDGKEPKGVFVDSPARVTFHVDVNHSGVVEVIVESADVKLYTISGDGAYDITRQFLNIIGRSFIPPLWAFGYGQSRWGYKNHKDIDKVVAEYKKVDIPLDYICLDIDYMDRYIDFTINEKRFPNMKEYVEEKKKEGIHLVPIIDAGVKVEPGNETYEVGISNGYFATNEEGGPFHAAVWPGMTHFPDFFQSATREWFGSEYHKLTDLGFEGFWNDMNEPSIFYSEYSHKQNKIDQILDFLMPSRAEKKEGSKNNSYHDYKHFYHMVEGKRRNHHDVHNLFGGLMIRASGEGLSKLLNKRYLLFARSSYIGAHRYGGIWTGDNHSSFEMLQQNLSHMASLNMCGFLYSGADTGGFGGNCSRELLLRWLAFSDFTPLMRNHSALGTKKQECYRYDQPEDFKRIIALRYRLLPYLYSEFMKAALNKDMYMKPLGFIYPNDEKARACEDQLLVGEGIMIAPILEEGRTKRKVYLPEEMIGVRFDGDHFAEKKFAAGEIEIDVPLNEVVFFIRKDHKVCIANKLVKSTKDLNLRDVKYLGYDVEYEQYKDDGESKL
ncbi:MAG: alpha-glucosidase [Lachnospiraceae bacterium]|nr:alpha-glucosidase [Lachnospiraceae bacterium]